MGGITKAFGDIFGGGDMPTVSPAPPAPAPGNPEADAAARDAEEKRRQTLAAGRASTILTGGTGDTTQAVTASKMLLGG